MVALHLAGSRWEEDAATLDVSGGNYLDEGEARSLIWIDHRRVQTGQVVRIASVADAQSKTAGKTIAELYPDEAPCAQTDFTPTEAMFEEVRKRPLLRGGYTFRLATSTGMEYTGHTRDDEYGFTLSVLWTAQYRPECARFSLRSITFEQLRTRAPARDHVRGDLWLGQSLRFQITPGVSG
jgi:hypothetical protein